jgi:hypothetical protein
MNKKTLERLKHNPHYKLNRKQTEELDQEERPEMAKFGGFQGHNPRFTLNNSDEFESEGVVNLPYRPRKKGNHEKR